jgi:hypothetical protein
MPEPSPEYQEARRVLLDALEALDPHRDALILVGAQAIYLHAPLGDPRPAYTTDGDLAVDPDLLAENPDLASELEAAGFELTESGNPGSWESPTGVVIDLMVPDGALPRSSRRSAQLAGHATRSARRTRGLEVALYDNTEQTLIGLSDGDTREVGLRVASPAALLIAKLVKIEERLSQPKPDRVLPKDAGDILRLLRNVDAVAIGTRLRAIANERQDLTPLIEGSLRWMQDQVEARSSALVDLTIRHMQEVEPPAQVDIALRTFAGRVVDGYRASEP